MGMYLKAATSAACSSAKSTPPLFMSSYMNLHFTDNNVYATTMIAHALFDEIYNYACWPYSDSNSASMSPLFTLHVQNIPQRAKVASFTICSVLCSVLLPSSFINFYVRPLVPV